MESRVNFLHFAARPQPDDELKAGRKIFCGLWVILCPEIRGRRGLYHVDPALCITRLTKMPKNVGKGQNLKKYRQSTQLADSFKTSTIL